MKLLPGGQFYFFRIGTLSAVSSLMLTVNSTTIYLTWIAPFTLDIRGIDPDLSYCVHVTIGNTQANSTCGITDTEFHYSIPPGVGCDPILFTVIPVNIVDNGTQETISYRKCAT